MYKKKIPFDIDCGIKITMEVMGGKWKSCIIQELSLGAKRPSELHRLFEEASPRVINQEKDILGTSPSFRIFHNRNRQKFTPDYRTA